MFSDIPFIIVILTPLQGGLLVQWGPHSSHRCCPQPSGRWGQSFAYGTEHGGSDYASNVLLRQGLLCTFRISYTIDRTNESVMILHECRYLSKLEKMAVEDEDQDPDGGLDI